MIMTEKEYFLGIDTSNYKTSIAVVDGFGKIIADERKFLTVKKGERGIRQSEALFQHINNLPVLLESLTNYLEIKNQIKAVAVSKKPRPLENSYMPVFNAGCSIGKSLSYILGIPLYEFSHQEGHIEAIKFNNFVPQSLKFIAFHFSGGTTEAILVDETLHDSKKYEIVGGSRDISYGQLLDRVGVSLGMEFPCGEAMDKSLFESKANYKQIKLPPIKVNDGFINISGIETACQRITDISDSRDLIYSLFIRIIESIEEMTEQLSGKYGISDFIYAGGVASSRFIRENLRLGYNLCFGEPKLSADNAVGIALLGRNRYGIETDNSNTIK